MNNATKRGSAARDRALTAAVRVFSANGFEASLNDVALDAGMSRQNLLYYFPSKRDLIVAVLNARDADLNARLQWMEATPTQSFDDFVRRLIDVVPQIYADRELVLLYHRLTSAAADPEHPGHEWLRDRYSRTRDATRAMFERAVHVGELRAGIDVDGLVTALLGAIEGIETQWLVEPALEWRRATTALLSLVDLARPST